MAKRGRKPKTERKGYFYEAEEQAIQDYISTQDTLERGKIYNSVLRPALERMVEAIIHRYRMYVPDEEYEQTFSDTLSYLITKLNNFKPEKETKAYSYCGTIVRNYLKNKVIQYNKKLNRDTPYDLKFEESYDNNDTYVEEETDDFADKAEMLISGISKEIKSMLADRERYQLKDDEVKVGSALCELLDNWETISLSTSTPLYEGSNKLMKSRVLYFLREETMMSTKALRDNMKCYKKLYYVLKQKEMD